MAIFVPEYWPLFTTDEQLVSNFYASDGSGLHFTSIFSYDRALNSMEFQNYGANGNWLNTWFYQYQPGFGIAEWQDQYPQTGILATLFGPVKQVTMSTPIGWGDWANIGSTYTNSPSINPLKSNPPGQFGTGYQAVTFEALDPTFTLSNGTTYTNVLVFADVQIWRGQAQETWFWMAQGLGPIAIQFFAPDPSTGVLEPSTLFDRASPLTIPGGSDPAEVLIAGPGDTLQGAESGNDMFVFAGNFGQVTVDDFITGGPAHDTLLLDRSDFANLAQVIANTQQVGSSTVITDPLNRADAITLPGVNAAILTSNAKNFAFA
jgi:hypothetical protein